MDEADVYSYLRELFAKLFGRDDIVLKPELTARDVVGWDSLRQVEITLALQEKYGIRLRARDTNQAANLGELVALVVRQVERGA
jgi:acyl carrier protein